MHLRGDTVTALPERASERESFNRQTKNLYDGDPLANVAAMLEQSAKAQPPQGSWSQMLTIASNEVAFEISKKKKARKQFLDNAMRSEQNGAHGMARAWRKAAAILKPGRRTV